MPPPESFWGVWVHRTFVGVLRQRGATVQFSLHPSYTEDPRRPVLGLAFEQDLSRVHSARLRLPPWFSNLLPEGALRRWIAQQRGVPIAREVELLAEVGHDLPGAVTVLPLPAGAVPLGDDDAPEQPRVPPEDVATDPRGRFSLAGVQLKLSMVAAGDRLVVPLGGTLGDWIVKFPDATFPHLPVVEFATMELARASGIEVPETRLVERDQLPDTPDALWGRNESVAFAIKRFDRGPERTLIHIEDLAQVQDVWPEQKYEGAYERLAALVHRGYDDASLREFTRRLALNLLVDNSDGHAKNWSLLYEDPRKPRLSPAYDLVSVAPYEGYGGQVALSLAGLSAADELRLHHFGQLRAGSTLRADDMVSIAEHTLRLAEESWPRIAELHLSSMPDTRSAIDAIVRKRGASLRSGG